MRKTIFALAALILLATLGCSKDDDNNISIVGKWTLESSTTQYYENGATEPTDVKSYDRDTDGISTITYNADKTYLDVSDGENTTGTYSYDPGNKKLTQTPSGSPFGITLDVTQLTSGSLKLHYDFSSTDDGTAYRFVGDATYKR